MKTPGSGRKKGTPNKSSLKVEEIAAQFGCDPIEMLCRVIMMDWKGLGYDSDHSVIESDDGSKTWTKERITLDHRINAAKDLAKYMYSQKKAIEVSNAPGTEGFKVILEDYTSK